MQESAKEKKNKRIAMITSIGVHAAVFLLFLFIVAWSAPDPPLPEYGIEINMGFDQQGSGDVQPQAPVGTEEQSEDPANEIKNDEPQETEEPAPSESKPAETKPVTQPVTSTQDSPEVIKEEKKPETKPIEKPVEKPVEKKPNPATQYNPNSTNTTADNTQTKAGEKGSEGDDKNKTGDKGDPKGVNQSTVYSGKAGGGDDGSSLDIAGWKWDNVPHPKVPNNETGRVVFEIKVSEDGEIISYKTIERSVSLEAEAICKKELEKLTFSKTGTNVPKESVGKITFVIRSN